MNPFIEVEQGNGVKLTINLLFVIKIIPNFGFTEVFLDNRNHNYSEQYLILLPYEQVKEKINKIMEVWQVPKPDL